MKKIATVIDTLNRLVGYLLGIITLLLCALVVYEVVARYVFNAPTIWSMEINQFLFCTMTLLGAGFCLLRDEHVRVDLLYLKYSVRTRAIVEMCTFPLALILCVVLIYFGSGEFWYALVQHKTSGSAADFPMWPIWFMIPAGGVLLALQIIARYLRNIMDLKSGGDESQ